MDKNNTGDEELKRDDWVALLFLLMMRADQNQKDVWNRFEHELVYSNRFYADSPIIEEIKKKAGKATRIIPEETAFYRARIFRENVYDRLLKYYLKENGFNRDQIREALDSWPEEIKALMQPSGKRVVDNPDGVTSLKKEGLRWKRSVKFQGYNASESSAPKPDSVGNGRANPDHIRYLYLCEDRVTPVYEVRPVIGDYVSVAKFRLQKEVKVYDLTLDIKDVLKDGETEITSLFNIIGGMFSRPLNGDRNTYLPTQYLAEEIKRMGFDGLRYNSSLHSGGVNVVLFDPDVCKALSSDLIAVKGIELNLEEPDFFCKSFALNPEQME